MFWKAKGFARCSSDLLSKRHLRVRVLSPQACSRSLSAILASCGRRYKTSARDRGFPAAPRDRAGWLNTQKGKSNCATPQIRKPDHPHGQGTNFSRGFVAVKARKPWSPIRVLSPAKATLACMSTRPGGISFGIRDAQIQGGCRSVQRHQDHCRFLLVADYAFGHQMATISRRS